MNINFYNVPFKGISATATTTNGEKINIDLPEDDARLIAIGKEDPRTGNPQFDDSFIIKISDEKRKLKRLKEGVEFDDIEIENVNGNSRVVLGVYGERNIHKIEDNGQLLLNHTTAVIDEISGENAKIFVGKNSGFFVKKQSQVNIQPENLYVREGGNCTLTAKGQNFRYYA